MITPPKQTKELEQFLKDSFCYCPFTGILKWKKEIPNKYFKSNGSRGCFNRSLGSVAGYKKKRKYTNYIEIKSLGFRFLAHRAAWFLMNDSWPNVIDHKDQNGENNKWLNLRSVTKRMNAQNARLFSNNKSGHVGVFFDTRKAKWRAEICISGKNTFLGYFESIEKAAKARDNASSANLFHINHGK